MATERKASLVGRRLNALRSARGLSASQLADLVPGHAVSKTVITNVESGRKRDLTVTELVLLADALDVSPLFLIVDPQRPWEVVDIPGIEMTNIEYARRSDIWKEYGFDSAFWGGPHAVESALVSGEEAVAALDEVRRVLDIGEPSPDYVTARPHHIEVSPKRILGSPDRVLQGLATQLVEALDNVDRLRVRDAKREPKFRQLDSDLVANRDASLRQALDQLKAEYPELNYDVGHRMDPPRAPRPNRNADASPSDSAE